MTEIEAALERIEQAARAPLAPADFYSRLLAELDVVCRPLAGLVWNCHGRNFELLAHTGDTVESLCRNPDYREQHTPQLRGIVDRGQSVVERFSLADGSSAPASFWLLAAGVVADQQTTAIVEIWLGDDTDQPSRTRGLRLLEAVCELAGEFAANHRRRDLAQSTEFWRCVTEFSNQLQTAETLPETSLTVVNQVRRLAQCDRVSLALVRHGRCRLSSISDTDWFDRRAEPVRALERLAKVFCTHEEAIWFGPAMPPPAPEFLDELNAFVDVSHARLLGVIPLTSPRNSGTVHEHATPARAEAMLMVECFGGDDPLNRRRRVEAMLPLTAGAVSRALRLDGLPLLSVSRFLRDNVTSYVPRRWLKLGLVILVPLIIAAVLCLVRTDFYIEARGELLPLTQRHVFAPEDGVIRELAVDHADLVKAGQVLLELRSPALDREQLRVQGELDATRERIRAIQSARVLSDAEESNRNGRTDAVRLSAEIEQLNRTSASLVEQQKVLRQQQQSLTVRSPITGRILTWQVDELLATRPVRRGQQLLTVAQIDGDWKLRLEVADAEISHVRAAQREFDDAVRVSYLLENNPDVTYEGRLRDVAASTEQTPDGRRIVPADVAITKNDLDELRPSAGVVGRIHCGRRAVGYVWFRKVLEFIQLNWPF